MQVTSNTNTAGTDTASTANTRVPQKVLGQSDFLKLLTVQLAKQDPMKPMEDTSFIAQMAQFSSLQQTQEMVKEFGQLRYSSDLSSASMLLGRTVTVQETSDSEITGVVSGIDASDGTPQLVVNGKLYPLSLINRVEPAQLPAA
jgi:flagellar basal-body rod modification protein FlgD